MTHRVFRVGRRCLYLRRKKRWKLSIHLKTGKRCILRFLDLRLDAEVTIEASHVVIKGAPSMTHVYCASDINAFTIEYACARRLCSESVYHCRFRRGASKVTFSGLGISDCSHSALALLHCSQARPFPRLGTRRHTHSNKNIMSEEENQGDHNQATLQFRFYDAGV